MKNSRSQSQFVLSRRLPLFFLYVLLISGAFGQNDFIYRLLEPHDDLKTIISDSINHRVQILYTQIDRDKDNKPKFTSHGFRVEENEYFYPASTIKIFAAILALEKINNLGIDGLNKEGSLKFNGRVDSVSQKANSSLAHDIKKILVASDNTSFNRLYDFLGQGEINDRLNQTGFYDTKIRHRLSMALSAEENRYTPGFSMYDKAGRIEMYTEKPKYNPTDLSSEQPVFLGESFMKNDSLINQPMNFQFKNVSSISDLQNGIRKLLFPESGQGTQFNLSSEDLTFIYQYMSQLPRETSEPDYSDKPDNYCKFFMYGADASAKIPDHIRIFNKIGLAYGFTIDNAYIIDLENNIEFLLTAVIYTNENKTLNDGKYEYESIAFPFFQKLGEVIYDFELNRKKEFIPKLERFNLDYDK